MYTEMYRGIWRCIVYKRLAVTKERKLVGINHNPQQINKLKRGFNVKQNQLVNRLNKVIFQKDNARPTKLYQNTNEKCYNPNWGIN